MLYQAEWIDLSTKAYGGCILINACLGWHVVWALTDIRKRTLQWPTAALFTLNGTSRNTHWLGYIRTGLRSWSLYQLCIISPAKYHVWINLLLPTQRLTTGHRNNGINCKARLVDVLQSDLRNFLTHGGMCKAIVRGVRCDALQEEPGWVARFTNYFIRANWLILDRGAEYFGGDLAQILKETHGDNDSHNKIKHESMDLMDEEKN